jgi:hypothetical protein
VGAGPRPQPGRGTPRERVGQEDLRVACRGLGETEERRLAHRDRGGRDPATLASGTRAGPRGSSIGSAQRGEQHDSKRAGVRCDRPGDPQTCQSLREGVEWRVNARLSEHWQEGSATECQFITPDPYSRLAGKPLKTVPFTPDPYSARPLFRPRSFFLRPEWHEL